MGSKTSKPVTTYRVLARGGLQRTWLEYVEGFPDTCNPEGAERPCPCPCPCPCPRARAFALARLATLVDPRHLAAPGPFCLSSCRFLSATSSTPSRLPETRRCVLGLSFPSSWKAHDISAGGPDVGTREGPGAGRDGGRGTDAKGQGLRDKRAHGTKGPTGQRGPRDKGRRGKGRRNTGQRDKGLTRQRLARHGPTGRQIRGG